MSALAQLRHMYQQMLNGSVKDTAEAARGLLGPAIEQLENGAQAVDEHYLAALEAERDALLKDLERARDLNARLAGRNVALLDAAAEVLQCRADGSFGEDGEQGFKLLREAVFNAGLP